MTLSLVSKPVSALTGSISVPGDKSMSHRAVMLGAIAEGVTTVDGFLLGDDCLATVRAFEAMGVVTEQSSDGSLIIQGVGLHGLKSPKAPIDCGNSGTSMRLLAGLLAAQSFDSSLTGDESLLKRPMARIRDPLCCMGADVQLADNDTPPIRIYGKKRLKGIAYPLPVASAQVKSCLLLAGLYASGPMQLMESTPTRDHTERLLSQYAYSIDYKPGLIVLNGSSCGVMGRDVVIPGDISSAAFFIVAATLIPGASLCIQNVGVNPTRTGLLSILKRMGANIELSPIRYYGEEPVADVTVCYAPLQGIDIPESMIPMAIDECPILCIAAACAHGQTVLRGARELRYKESDRIAVMAEGLTRLGINAKTLPDGLIIKGGHFSGGVVDSHRDHRVAMAFLVAGALATAPITVLNAHEITTSFPTFSQLANQIGLCIE